MERQFTASIAILHKKRFLLIHHRKLGVWLPPGGHVDANELPSDAAIREALEETGLQVAIINPSFYQFNLPHAKSIPSPYCCALQNIPTHRDQPAHQHIDLLYVAKPIGNVENLVENGEETNGIKWFSVEELSALESGKDIFYEVKAILQNIAQEFAEVASVLN